MRDVDLAARAIGLQIRVHNASTSGEIDASFAAFARERPDALFIASSPFFSSRRVQLVQMATRHAIPAAYAGRHFPEVGGLMSYGANLVDVWRQLGLHVSRVLKGAKPAETPVVRVDKFELVINHQTARMLGIDRAGRAAGSRRRGDRMSRTAFATALAIAVIAAEPTDAQSVEDFYRGKTVNILVGFTAGGGYDLYARLLGRHIGRHIPGNPHGRGAEHAGRRQPEGHAIRLRRRAQGRH